MKQAFSINPQLEGSGHSLQSGIGHIPCSLGLLYCSILSLGEFFSERQKSGELVFAYVALLAVDVSRLAISRGGFAYGAFS
jgi:hypothetical protein